MGYVENLPSGRYRGVRWNAAAGERGKSQAADAVQPGKHYTLHLHDDETDPTTLSSPCPICPLPAIT